MLRFILLKKLTSIMPVTDFDHNRSLHLSGALLRVTTNCL